MRWLSLETSPGPSSFFFRKESMTHFISQACFQLPRENLNSVITKAISRLSSLLKKLSIAQEEAFGNRCGNGSSGLPGGPHADPLWTGPPDPWRSRMDKGVGMFCQLPKDTAVRAAGKQLWAAMGTAFCSHSSTHATLGGWAAKTQGRFNFFGFLSTRFFFCFSNTSMPLSSIFQTKYLLLKHSAYLCVADLLLLLFSS